MTTEERKLSRTKIISDNAQMTIDDIVSKQNEESSVCMYVYWLFFLYIYIYCIISWVSFL